MGFSGASHASGAHAVLEQVDEGGVELAARSMFWREGLALVSDRQLLVPLSAEEVQTPRLSGHRVGAVVLACLVEDGKYGVGFFKVTNLLFRS